MSDQTASVDDLIYDAPCGTCKSGFSFVSSAGATGTPTIRILSALSPSGTNALTNFGPEMRQGHCIWSPARQSSQIQI